MSFGSESVYIRFKQKVKMSDAFLFVCVECLLDDFAFCKEAQSQ